MRHKPLKSALTGLLICWASFCGPALGRSWSPPQVIAGSSRMGIDIAVDANGNWHLVHDSSQGGYHIKYLSSTGAEDTLWTDLHTPVSRPSIDIDLNGDLHVAFRYYSTSVMYTTVASGPMTFYVDADAMGANDGSSWADAFNYLQDALAVAESGDEVRVAEGVYTPDEDMSHPHGTGDRTATFQLKIGVAIYGGYAGFGEPDPNARDVALYETILSGDLDGDDGPDFANNNENSYHVVTGSETDATAVLDGFTVTSGNANGTHDTGAGMHNFGACNPTVANCTFSGNRAVFGGGMGNQGDANPTVTDCFFRVNWATSDGGGMSNEASSPTLTNCTFRDNWARHGGGISCRQSSNPVVRSCVFAGNTTTDTGGINCHYSSSPTIIDCTIRENSARDHGGGIFCKAWGDLTIANSTISGNSARHGGGLCAHWAAPVITNCAFAQNLASETNGGGVLNYDSSPIFITVYSAVTRQT